MAFAIDKDRSEKETVVANQGWYDARVDINLVRPPNRFIYIFSVSKREFVIERPPLTPCLRVPRCEPGERYKLIAEIPDPFNQAVRDPLSGELVGKAHDGLRVAIDLVNPNNFTTNLDWEVPQQFAGELATGTGCDLSAQGLFISLSREPKEIEISKAEKKVENYYNRLRREIDLMNEKDALYAASMNKDYGMMADYFGLSYPWHKKMAALVACPNCGENIPKGAPWHVSALGPCINDWQRAVKAGIKKKEDVPEEILATWESSSSSGVASRPKPRT